MPGHLDLAGVLTGREASQLGVAPIVQPLVCLREQPPGAIQRVVDAASVAEGLVPHPNPSRRLKLSLQGLAPSVDATQRDSANSSREHVRLAFESQTAVSI